MGKFLDADGLKQVWDTAKGTFVKKRGRKRAVKQRLFR